MAAVGEFPYFMGIDAGSSSVKMVALVRRDEGDARIAWKACEAHKGSIGACAQGLIEQALAAGELAGGVCAGVVATGACSNVVVDAADGIAALEDVPAMTLGASVVAPRAKSVASMGAQNAFFIGDFAEGGAPQFAMNEGCAAGTGSFFEDQMGRLGLNIEDYSATVERAGSAPRLSGRCAVFAKTDIIHRQQEGVPVEDILLGLCFAMVKSYKATIVRKLPVQAPVLLAGGVVRNAGVVRAMREVFGLGEGELIASEDGVYVQAVGAALHAMARADSERAAAQGGKDAGGKGDARSRVAANAGAVPFDLRALAAALGESCEKEELPCLRPLVDEGYVAGAGFEVKPAPWPVAADGRTPCVLGVDVGSTSTNLVLMDLEGELLDAQYLRTRGDAKHAVREGLASLAERLGDKVCVVHAATTGSGRTAIGEFIGADVVRDEITAQARAAVAADPATDTVFEIGGQDSKYISCSGGNVVDFQMNKICAAGTGSFVEEQAARLGIPLGEYGPLALSATSPVDLGERCTVFVETAINAALAKGASLADVAAGLCQSVVRNYLHRVVGTKPVGRHVVLQGGVAYNPAIVAAFRQALGDALTVSPWFAVSGAVGAALLALDAMRAAAGEGVASDELSRARSAFKGWDLSGAGRSVRAANAVDVEANRAFFRKTEEFYLEGYDPARDPAKKTVGVPRCLMLHKLFPMVNAFFRQLGFNVLLSDASNDDTVRRAQEYAQGETCYPVKLVYGHVSQLVDADVDYVFMPSMHTIRHIKSKVRHNYACPYMQVAPRLVADAFDFEGRGIELISPLMDMDFGQQALATALLGVGADLGFSPQESAKAMLAGGFAVQEFTRKTEEQGERLLASLEPSERVLVIITRQYGISDPALNMGIPDALLDRGQKVITVSHLHAHDLDISADHPDMYWPFGQHMLSGAKLVRRDPRLFAVYLTNHGCGPDTMVSHLFAEEMGDKPYLQIEMDEHFSQVGVITRIEAFLNSIDHWQGKDERALPYALHPRGLNMGAARLGEACILPQIGVFGQVSGAWLRGHGLDVVPVRHTPESFKLGQSELSSKEYYSFTSLLGMSLAAAQSAQAATDERSIVAGGEAVGAEGCLPARRRTRLLLPSSVGSDADGQYVRTIRSVLDAKGFAGVGICAPKLERLPWEVSDARGLFCALIAGDIAYAAAPVVRGELVRDAAAAAEKGQLDEGFLVDLASRAARSWGGVSPKATLALSGEWQCVFDDALVGGAWRRLEEAGYRVSRMPLSEYLLFAWRDAAQEDSRERTSTPFFMDNVSEAAVLAMPNAECCSHDQGRQGARAHGDGEACGGCGVEGRAAGCGACGDVSATLVAAQTAAADEIDAVSDATALPPLAAAADEPTFEEKAAVLDDFAGLMARVSAALGDATSFSDPRALEAAADSDLLGSYIGANGRYRAAKSQATSRSANGVIVAASMYENTDIVLKLGQKAGDFDAPVLRLNFDGTLDASVDEKLRSFLYYLQ